MCIYNIPIWPSGMRGNVRILYIRLGLVWPGFAKVRHLLGLRDGYRPNTTPPENNYFNEMPTNVSTKSGHPLQPTFSRQQ